MTSVGHIIAARTGKPNFIERMDLAGVKIRKGPEGEGNEGEGDFESANYDTLETNIGVLGLGNRDGKISAREFDARIQQLANKHGEVTIQLPNGREYTIKRQGEQSGHSRIPESTQGGGSGISSSGLGGSDSVSLSSPEARNLEVTSGGMRPPVSAPQSSTIVGNSMPTIPVQSTTPAQPYSYQHQINSPAQPNNNLGKPTWLQRIFGGKLENGSFYSPRFGEMPPK
jgi:hypothetical protein